MSPLRHLLCLREASCCPGPASPALTVPLVRPSGCGRLSRAPHRREAGLPQDRQAVGSHSGAPGLSSMARPGEQFPACSTGVFRGSPAHGKGQASSILSWPGCLPPLLRPFSPFSAQLPLLPARGADPPPRPAPGCCAPDVSTRGLRLTSALGAPLLTALGRRQGCPLRRRDTPFGGALRL